MNEARICFHVGFGRRTLGSIQGRHEPGKKRAYVLAALGLKVWITEDQDRGPIAQVEFKCPWRV